MHSTIDPLLVETAHEDRKTVNDHQNDPDQKIEGGGRDARNREWFSSVLVGIIFDLHHLIDAQNDCDYAGYQTNAATPSKSNCEDAADHRRDRHALFRPLLIRRRRRRLPTALHLLRRLKWR